MIIRSINPVYRPDPAGIRVTEWTTRIDEKTHKEYHHSRSYTIRLYTKLGELKEYNKPSNINVSV